MTEHTQKKRSRRHGGGDPSVPLYPRPEEMWGRVLPGPGGAASPDDFEARVQQAWAYMKGAFFAAEEHARLYSCIREMLAQAEDAR